MIGTISQWGEVKKKQPKLKEQTHDSSTRGRGRGGLEGRGRGRGAERGARGSGAGRGSRQVSQAAPTNGVKSAGTIDGWAAETATATATNGDATAHAEEWANDAGKDKLASLETDKPKPASSAAPTTTKAGAWASLFSKPAPAPTPVAQKSASAPKTETLPTPLPASVHEETTVPEIPTAQPEETAPVPADEPVTKEEFVPPPIEPITVDDGPSELPSAPHSDGGISELAPATSELTKENVNKLPDASHPVATATAASTVASTQAQAEPVNPALPNVQSIRPGMSGHAASALRATSGVGRSASYSRKVMDQQEAVVMPGNHAVDRTAVQFGKMGLDSSDVDADEDREEPETRTQLPDDSPAAPRASLPPAPPAPEVQQSTQPAAPEPVAEPQAQRPASGLPSAPQAIAEPSPPQPSAFPDQYRYGQAQKSYDPFNQQSQGPQGPSEPFSNQLPGQSHPPTSQQEAYQQQQQQYYGREHGSYYGYNHGYDQQRSGSAFGSSAQEAPAQYAAAGPRGYGSQDVTAGGSTPGQNTSAHQSQHSGHVQGPHSHAGYPYVSYGANYGQYPQYGSYGSMGHGGHATQQTQGNHGNRYGANRPAFDDVRRQEEFYANQNYYSQNQGYSNSYNKSHMYGGPQHQYSQDYSSSPGNSAFTGRDAYARTGSTQPTDAQSTPASSNAFGSSMPDPFGRTPSGFGHGVHGSEDPAKPTGPSPSLQGGRPGSAAQSMGSQQQTGLPHPQGGQQAFGGYPQYGGFGNQNSQHSSYAGYGGSNNAFAGYGAAYGRGWGGNQYGSGQH